MAVIILKILLQRIITAVLRENVLRSYLPILLLSGMELSTIFVPSKYQIIDEKEEIIETDESYIIVIMFCYSILHVFQ